MTTQLRITRTRLLAGVIASLATVAATAAPAVGGSTAGSTPPWLDHPRAITISEHGHLWIANSGDNTVDQVSTGGSIVRQISAVGHDIDDPFALTMWEGRVVVVNHAGSVSEFAAQTGNRTRWIHGAKYDFGGASAIAVYGSTAWIADTSAGVVTEVNLANGALIRVIHTGINHPHALTIAGHNVWVVDANNQVVALSRATGAVVHTAGGDQFGFEAPRGIGYDGAHLWVSNSGNDSVTELTSTGQFVQVVNNSTNNANYGFDAPNRVVVHGGEVYVISPPGASPMVTKIDPDTANGYWFECNTNVPDPGFANPTDLAVNNGRIWVVSPKNSSLAELTVTTGALIHRWAD